MKRRDWTRRDEERLGPGTTDHSEGVGVLIGRVLGQHQR